MCVDVFTRFTRTAALKGAKSEDVVKAFRAFDRLPETVDSDEGPEFSSAFEAYLRENHGYRPQAAMQVQVCLGLALELSSMPQAYSLTAGSL